MLEPTTERACGGEPIDVALDVVRIQKCLRDREIPTRPRPTAGRADAVHPANVGHSLVAVKESSPQVGRVRFVRG